MESIDIIRSIFSYLTTNEQWKLREVCRVFNQNLRAREEHLLDDKILFFRLPYKQIEVMEIEEPEKVKSRETQVSFKVFSNAICRVSKFEYFFHGGRNLETEASEKTVLVNSQNTKILKLLPPSNQHYEFKRFSHACSFYNGYVYLFGGLDTEQKTRREAMKYCLKEQTWSQIASLPEPISKVTCTTCQAGILVGGQGSPDVYLYSPTQDNYVVSFSGLPENCMKILMKAKYNLVYMIVDQKLHKLDSGNWEEISHGEKYPQIRHALTWFPTRYRNHFYFCDGMRKLYLFSLENFELKMCGEYMLSGRKHPYLKWERNYDHEV